MLQNGMLGCLLLQNGMLGCLLLTYNGQPQGAGVTYH
jgi:hypothetical protein